VRRLFWNDRRTSLRLFRLGRPLDGHRARLPRGPLRRSANAAVIRIILPAHLRALARVNGEVSFEITGEITQRTLLDALESRYPMLRGTIRDHVTQRRRPYVRFFACEKDLSHQRPDAALPQAVAEGLEPFLVVGAMAGG
jgi:molybdopterin synthase sulfur carrier subunit